MTKPSTGVIIGFSIALFLAGGLLAACLIPFCFPRKKKPVPGGYEPPVEGYGAAGGYGGYGG